MTWDKKYWSKMTNEEWRRKQPASVQLLWDMWSIRDAFLITLGLDPKEFISLQEEMLQNRITDLREKRGEI